VTVLVTGGAGYIGSHVVEQLLQRGDDVVIVDDLSTGQRRHVGKTPFYEIDLTSENSVERLQDVIARHSIDSVIHFAAKKSVSDSVARPLYYFQQNVGGLLRLLDAIASSNVSHFVFSSSAAVYGNAVGLVKESASTAPTNAYGDSKLMGEKILERVSATSNLRAVSLRYFNVAGAGSPDLADVSVSNLIPMVFERIRGGNRPFVFGDDYETPDGSCVRDFVHVVDLAQAHLAALDFLTSTGDANSIFNIGTGQGYSVKEIIDVIQRESGFTQGAEIAARRPGDPAQIVADVTRARDILKWEARLGVEDMVASAWRATPQ
jgi:UDP-glucose 4-epimerase